MKYIAKFIALILFTFSCKENKENGVFIKYNGYLIRQTIKPHNFIDGPGSALYTEIFSQEKEKLYEDYDGINFVNANTKNQQLHKAKKYIDKINIIKGNP